VLSGDFVFVGDVGRPDLLERAANRRGTMEQGARELFRSLQQFKRFPDYLQIWPGHGAGSACGKALGAVPQSTLGYERLANWAFAINEEAPFVAAVLEGQPEPPKYFAEMKRINKEGPRVLGGLARPGRLPASRLGDLLAAGTLVVDTRLAAAFVAAHVPGTINIPLNRAFTTWAGWLIPYDREFHLLIDSARDEAVETAVRDLAMIGLDRVAGYFDGDETLEAWRASDGTLSVTPQMSVAELRERLGGDAVTVIDVRGRAEWEAGHLPGVANIPLGLLPDRLDELPARGAIVLHCETASRSAIAASLLEARGRRDVADLIGGFTAWRQAGYPIEVESPVPA
jgi:hydroxyacylglutathione hydrolase